jgi:hypothetical protein
MQRKTAFLALVSLFPLLAIIASPATIPAKAQGAYDGTRDFA